MLQLLFDSPLYILNVPLNGTLAAYVFSIKAYCTFADWTGLMPELSHHLELVLTFASGFRATAACVEQSRVSHAGMRVLLMGHRITISVCSEY